MRKLVGCVSSGQRSIDGADDLLPGAGLCVVLAYGHGGFVHTVHIAASAKHIDAHTICIG